MKLSKTLKLEIHHFLKKGIRQAVQEEYLQNAVSYMRGDSKLQRNVYGLSSVWVVDVNWLSYRIVNLDVSLYPCGMASLIVHSQCDRMARFWV